MSLFRRIGKEQDGVMAVEFSLLLPVLVFIMFGMIELTDAIAAKRRVNLAASMIGDLVTNTDADFVQENDMRSILAMGGRVLEPYGIKDTTVRVTAVTYDASDDAYEVVWSRERRPNGNTQKTSAEGYQPRDEFERLEATGTYLDANERLVADGDHIVVVEIDYPFKSSVSNITFPDGFDIAVTELRVPRQSEVMRFCGSTKCTGGVDWVEAMCMPQDWVDEGTPSRC